MKVANLWAWRIGERKTSIDLAGREYYLSMVCPRRMMCHRYLMKVQGVSAVTDTMTQVETTSVSVAATICTVRMESGKVICGVTLE